MTLLSRYLIRQNLFLLFAILLMSTGLYLLTDFFERLDNFLESGTSAKMVLIFFSVKIPLIISQILPAVFMLAMVAQMNFLQRSRELIALTAGGISPMALVRFGSPTSLARRIWSIIGRKKARDLPDPVPVVTT